MPEPENSPPAHRRTDRYGMIAFAAVVVTCYSGFAFAHRIDGTPLRLALTFALGGVYTLVTILGHSYCEPADQDWMSSMLAAPSPRLVGRYLLQCALVTGVIFVSPLQGFFGIIVLPVVSQAYFDFQWRGAALATVCMFAATIGVFWYRYGVGSVPEAMFSFSAAFAFTIAFTLVTRQALVAKERAEKLREEVEAANRRLREFAAQAGDLATTRERNRLAREIHDGLGHYLTVVKTQLDAATALLPAQPDKARESVAKAAHLTAEALDDVRRSVGALRTDAPRPSLPQALLTLTQEAGLPVAVRLEGAPRPLPPAIEHALFRSAQEGLTNIRKHAAAAAAEIILDFRAAGRVTLTVTDNGHGTRGTNGTAGFGLIGLRERIEVLGGQVTAGNRPAGGFVLTIEVPA